MEDGDKINNKQALLLREKHYGYARNYRSKDYNTNQEVDAFEKIIIKKVKNTSSE